MKQIVNHAVAFDNYIGVSKDSNTRYFITRHDDLYHLTAISLGRDKKDVPSYHNSSLTELVVQLLRANYQLFSFNAFRKFSNWLCFDVVPSATQITEEDLGLSVDQVTECRYYGVQVSNAQRGFITKTDYNNGEYTVRCLCALTMGNGWCVSVDNKTDLVKYIRSLLSEPIGYTVYEFNTYRELTAWLTEEGIQ